MRHDYNHPPDWEALTDQQKSDWMLNERCRRQAIRQFEAAPDHFTAMKVTMEMMDKHRDLIRSKTHNPYTDRNNNR